MSDAPTDRQRTIIEVIAEITATTGAPPTIRELARALNIKSTNGVSDHLLYLEKKGYVERPRPKVHRGARLTEKGYALLGASARRCCPTCKRPL